jgi:hypothetical protein
MVHSPFDGLPDSSVPHPLMQPAQCRYISPVLIPAHPEQLLGRVLVSLDS